MESSSWSPSSAVYQGAKQDHHGARCKLNPSASPPTALLSQGKAPRQSFQHLSTERIL